MRERLATPRPLDVLCKHGVLYECPDELVVCFLGRNVARSRLRANLFAQNFCSFCFFWQCVLARKSSFVSVVLYTFEKKKPRGEHLLRCGSVTTQVPGSDGDVARSRCSQLTRAIRRSSRCAAAFSRARCLAAARCALAILHSDCGCARGEYRERASQYAAASPVARRRAPTAVEGRAHPLKLQPLHDPPRSVSALDRLPLLLHALRGRGREMPLQQHRRLALLQLRRNPRVPSGAQSALCPDARWAIQRARG